MACLVLTGAVALKLAHVMWEEEIVIRTLIVRVILDVAETIARRIFHPPEATGRDLLIAVKVSTEMSIIIVSAIIKYVYAIQMFPCNVIIKAVPTKQCDGVPSTDWSCCSKAAPCSVGGGDCDNDRHCAGTLTCGSNNCRTDFSSSGSSWSAAADCCTGKFSNANIPFCITGPEIIVFCRKLQHKHL